MAVYVRPGARQRRNITTEYSEQFGTVYDSGRYPLRQHFLPIGAAAGDAAASIGGAGGSGGQAGERGDTGFRRPRANFAHFDPARIGNWGEVDDRAEAPCKSSTAQEETNRIKLRPRVGRDQSCGRGGRASLKRDSWRSSAGCFQGSIPRSPAWKRSNGVSAAKDNRAPGRNLGSRHSIGRGRGRRSGSPAAAHRD